MITPGIQVQKALFHNDSKRPVTLVISIIYQIKSRYKNKFHYENSLCSHYSILSHVIAIGCKVLYV